MQRHEIERRPVNLIFQERSAFKETYGGAQDLVVCEGQHLVPVGAPPSRTLVLFMHPTGIMNLLPFPVALARSGVPVMTCGSRYPHNDSALILEKVVLDLGHYVRHARTILGYERVVLAGWSGGGSLSLLYQAEAEDPRIEATPAGDPVDLKGAGLIPADGLMQLAAHVSRAITLSEWIDPAIRDESDPGDRDPDLDIYGAPAAAEPPFSEAFQGTYRAAQRARIARITDRVRQRLDDLRKAGRPHDEHAFVVHGTMADLRWLDPAIDPNGRKPNWCYMGDPRVVNMSPAHLARYSSLRSWLSQWSQDSRGDGPACAARVSAPTLVLENGDDDACTPSHAARIRAGFRKVVPETCRIDGANHYYAGQPDRLAEAVAAVRDWLDRHGFVARAA